MSASPVPASPTLTPAALELDAVKRKHSLRSQSERRSEVGAKTSYLVENLLPQRQLAILLGNSGLGKSPALYQLGICASAGLPFLGEPTVETDVVYFDFENGSEDGASLAERISNFQGLQATPENYLRWHSDDCAAKFGTAGHTVEDMIRDWSKATSKTGRPKLAIIDPLRFWLNRIEDPRHADEDVQKAHRVIRETGTCILGVHHVRRVSGETAMAIPNLETDPRSWILGMSRGATALINSCDVRLGFDKAAIPFAHDRAGLVLAGFRRVRGQFGPVFVERVISQDDGEPLGYRRLASIELLATPDHIEAFAKFPKRFTFKSAAQIFGKSDSATDNLLKKCLALRLLNKDGREYVKSEP